MLIIQFLMPSFQCLLNFTCLGPDPYEIPIAIYNPDQPPVVSELFLNNLSNVTFKMTHYETLDSALEQVRKGLAWSVIAFQSNYTRTMQLMSTGDDVVKMPTIGLHLDTTNYVITNTIQKEVWINFNRTMHAAVDMFGLDESSVSASMQNPIEVASIVYGVVSPKMSEFMAPGNLICSEKCSN